MTYIQQNTLNLKSLAVGPWLEKNTSVSNSGMFRPVPIAMLYTHTHMI